MTEIIKRIAFQLFFVPTYFIGQFYFLFFSLLLTKVFIFSSVNLKIKKSWPNVSPQTKFVGETMFSPLCPRPLAVRVLAHSGETAQPNFTTFYIYILAHIWDRNFSRFFSCATNFVAAIWNLCQKTKFLPKKSFCL